MKIFSDTIKAWDKLKSKGERLPAKHGCSVVIFLLHNDKQKDRFTIYCAVNGIDFQIH